MATDSKKAQASIFQVEYERICFLRDICPLSQVTANLKENFIDINIDRIRVNEWGPILDALKVNNSLRFLALRSSWNPASPDDKKRRQHNKKKTPAIRSRDMTLRLAKSLKDCLNGNQCLQCLIIQNLPLREQDIRLIAKGITKCSVLRYLSLEQCLIGDELFELLVMGIKKSQCLVSINFSACNLTWKSAEQIAVIIKYQASQRHGEAWKDSLRYRRPDLDRLSGLHRVSLCDNMLSDNGARIIAEALKDDLWLKALDLQNCTISNDGALILKEALRFNKSLWVLDLRRNIQIEYDVLRAIIEQVMVNAGGEHDEYPWISSQDTKNRQRKSPNVPKKRPVVVKGAKVRRKESNAADSTFNVSKSVAYAKSVHYPWRTGERVKTNRHRSKNPLNNSVGVAYTCTQGKQAGAKANVSALRESIKEPDEEEEETESSESQDQQKYLQIIKELQIEVEFYKQKYYKEKEVRTTACDKLAQAEEANRKLQEHIFELEAKTAVAIGEGPKKVNVEDDVLDGIESSFQRFQQFLDMLENVGLGDLYNQMQQQHLQQPQEVDDPNPDEVADS